MNLGRKKSQLSPARQRLIELFQSINYGRLEDLVVRDGEPVLDPPPRVIRERKFASEHGRRPEAQLAEFVLTEQHLDLLDWLDEIGNGVIARISVKGGLPFGGELVG